MLKLIIFALFTLSAIQISYSREDWYEPAIRLSGHEKIGEIKDGTLRAVVHVRMKASQWSLCWQSEQGPCMATISLPPSDRQDDVYVTPATLTVVTGNNKEVYRIEGDVAYDDYNSIKIDYDGVKATLIVGAETAREVASVPIGPGDVAVTLTGDGLCQRIQLRQELTVSPTRYFEGDLAHLLQQISSSDDHNIALWEYFGKDADPSKASVGGHYILATVADGLDGYDIVYIAGGDHNTGKWQPTAIKGHLRPTIFADDFDLEWIDTSGQQVSGDTYARLSPDRSQITFGFPSQSATLKFRRVPHSDIYQKAGLQP